MCYVGFVLRGDRLVPQCVVLKKGGKLDSKKFFEDNGRPSLAAKYQTIAGPLLFFVLEEKNGDNK